MSETGYAYIPNSCANGAKCSLHFALHGCGQFASNPLVGTQYIKNSGYDRWAETNNMIIVYPQTFPDFNLIAFLNLQNLNPFSSINYLFSTLKGDAIKVAGCWDFAGAYDNYYDTYNGTQVKFIKSITDYLTS